MKNVIGKYLTLDLKAPFKIVSQEDIKDDTTFTGQRLLLEVQVSEEYMTLAKFLTEDEKKEHDKERVNKALKEYEKSLCR